MHPQSPTWSVYHGNAHIRVAILCVKVNRKSHSRLTNRVRYQALSSRLVLKRRTLSYFHTNPWLLFLNQVKFGGGLILSLILILIFVLILILIWMLYTCFIHRSTEHGLSRCNDMISIHIHIHTIEYLHHLINIPSHSLYPLTNQKRQFRRKNKLKKEGRRDAPLALREPLPWRPSLFPLLFLFLLLFSYQKTHPKPTKKPIY